MLGTKILEEKLFFLPFLFIQPFFVKINDHQSENNNCESDNSDRIHALFLINK